MADTTQPLGLGFIGSGRIAQAHLKAATSLPDRVRIAAIAGRRRDRAEAIAREYNVPAVHDDYTRLLTDPTVHAVVITTPNVLNTKSRIRYLLSGFANLFGPLPVRNDKLYSVRGHITPIPFFYLAHALLDAGFEKVELSIDKVQKTSVAWFVALCPFVFVGRLRFMARERNKFKTITAENAPLVASHFSWPLLVGRTIVVSAVKPVGSTVPAAAS